jgi:hypothetical protein
MQSTNFGNWPTVRLRKPRIVALREHGMKRRKILRTSKRRLLAVRKKQLYHRTCEGISEGYVPWEFLRGGKLREVHKRMLAAGLPVCTRSETMSIRAN